MRAIMNSKTLRFEVYSYLAIMVRIMYIMLNNLHRSFTSWFTGAVTEISML